MRRQQAGSADERGCWLQTVLQILTQDCVLLIGDPGHHPDGSALLEASDLTHLFGVHCPFLSCTVSYLDVFVGGPTLPHLTLVTRSVLSRRYRHGALLGMSK